MPPVRLNNQLDNSFNNALGNGSPNRRNLRLENMPSGRYDDDENIRNTMRRIQMLLNPNLVDVELGNNINRVDNNNDVLNISDTERRSRLANIYRIAPSPQLLRNNFVPQDQ
jgi:hypothetical protein